MGHWLESKKNPSAILEVIDVASDGGVKVRMDGKTVNTTIRYLEQNYQPFGGADK